MRDKCNPMVRPDLVALESVLESRAEPAQSRTTARRAALFSREREGCDFCSTNPEMDGSRPLPAVLASEKLLPENTFAPRPRALCPVPKCCESGSGFFPAQEAILY